MDPASGARRCLGAQRLRLLRELAGAHRRVRTRLFCILEALALLLAVQYAGVLLLTAASGEKLSALIAGRPGRNW